MAFFISELPFEKLFDFYSIFCLTTILSLFFMVLKLLTIPRNIKGGGFMRMLFMLLGCCLLSLALVFSASAEEAKKEAQKEATLEEIKVEATPIASGLPLELPASVGSGLDLTIREIPASVDIITKELMRERGQTTALQALENSAGVVVSHSFGIIRAFMRGFDNITGLPILYNGFRYPGLAMSPRGTFNYERIEVLKGPSSILHGLGSMAGAINYVTKKADGREEKELLLSYDRWDTKTAGFGIGGKHGDSLFYRFDASYMSADKGSFGFVDRSSFDYYHLSGEVALSVNDQLRVTLTGERYKDDAEGYFGTPIVNGKIDKRVRYKNYNVENDHLDKTVNWLSLKIENNPTKDIIIRNESYFNIEERFWYNTEVYTYNPSTGLVARGDFLHITHYQNMMGNRSEVSFNNSIGGMRNRLFIGFDLSRNRHQRDNNSPYAGSDTVDFLNPIPGIFSSQSPYLPARKTYVNNAAFFLEDYIDITKELKFTFSGRHDKINMCSHNLRDGTSFNKRWSGSSYRLGLLYDIMPNITLYAQHGNALEPPAQIVTLTPAQQGYGLTRAKQVEFGVKGNLPGNIGEATLAWFNLKRSDILTRDPNNPGLVIQIGEQSSKGVELAVVVRPIKELTVEANGAILNSEYDVFNESVSGKSVSRAGNLPPNVPEKVGNLWITYKPFRDWQIGTHVRHVGKRSANSANTVWMDAYTTLGAWITWKTKVGDWTLRGNNLTDRVYAASSYTDSQFVLGEPRSVSLLWTMKF